MSKKVKAFKLSQSILFGVADEGKVPESILICLMAAWSCKRRSLLVLVNCFCGINVKDTFYFLYSFVSKASTH